MLVTEWLRNCSIMWVIETFAAREDGVAVQLQYVCAVRMLPCDSHGNIRTAHTTYAAASRPQPIQKLGAENRTLQLNIWCSW